MAQILFGSDPTPANGDLDANFTELYNKTAWATSGVGYATGAGGAVTQLTSKSTTVTLNKLTGQITMNAAALASGAAVTFQVNDSLVTSNDVVCLAISGGVSSVANYNVWPGIANGSFFVNLRNISGGSLSEAVVINFVVLRGQIS